MDVVLEGLVVRSGDRVRITAQLVHGVTGRHLWAGRYERDFRDVLALQNDVARAIAHEVQPKLTPEAVARLSSAFQVNPEAYDNYLRGRFLLNQMTREGTRKAIDYFDAAIGQDPNFALAYAGLGEAWVKATWFLRLPPKECLTKAKTVSTKALKLDDSLAEAHLAHGQVSMYLDRDWPAAEREFRRAIELNPNHASAHLWLGIYLRVTGQSARETEECEKALELDPYSPLCNGSLVSELYYAGQFDRAAAFCEKRTGFGISSVTFGSSMGAIHIAQGNYAQATAELQGVMDESDHHPFVVSRLCYAYAASGRRAEALKLLRELEEQSKQRYVSGYYLAIAYMGLKDTDQALACLQRGVEENSTEFVSLRDEPLFDSLHPDPRFQDLLRRMGLRR